MSLYIPQNLPSTAETNAAAAIQTAIDSAHAAGGGTVLIPAGRTLLCGSIDLRSHVTLHFEPGSRLIASPDPAHYRNAVLLGAVDAENIAVTGTGTLDGRAKLFMASDVGHIYRYGPFRPRLAVLAYCRNVRVTDLTLADAANWCLHMTECDDVSIRGISILNDLRVPNCDGIDPDRCRNVRISDSFIQAGDDCIVLKTTSGKWDEQPGRTMGPCENIVVSNCTMISTSCALKIGTETHADIRNVLFQNCVIRNSARGLGIFLRDGGNIENVLFSNCTVETRLFHTDWWGKAEPIYVTSFNRTPGGMIGRIRNVRFSNIICRGENGAFISGCPDSMPEDVMLENVQITVEKRSKYVGGYYDRRPGIAGIAQHPTAGVYVQQTHGTVLRNADVRWGTHEEYYGFALEAHRARRLAVENFRGENAHSARPATLIDNEIPRWDELLKQKD